MTATKTLLIKPGLSFHGKLAVCNFYVDVLFVGIPLAIQRGNSA